MKRTQFRHKVPAHLLDPCILCDGNGEVWFSGRMVPCICDNVASLNFRLREELEQLKSENERLQAMAAD